MAIYYHTNGSFSACIAAHNSGLNSYLAIDIILCPIAAAKDGIVDMKKGIVCIKNDTVCTKNSIAGIVYRIARTIRGPTSIMKHTVYINEWHRVSH